MIESNGNMYMPVAPAYGYGNGGNCGMFGGDWAWIILLLLLGWGNNSNGFGGGGMGRYSSRDGGGYSSHGDFRTEMQDLMNQAPNDYVRQKMMEAMNGM